MRTVLFMLAIICISCNGNDEVKTPNETGKKDSTIRLPESNPYAVVDVSPMDMVYYPIDYPKLKMTGEADQLPLVRVIYSRPKKAGRTIFGGLQKYGEPWRLGANESTEIEFYKSATIQNKKVDPGSYILYCIPDSTSWTIVLNSNVHSWGLRPDPSKDVARFTVPTQQPPSPFELFTIGFEKKDQGADMVMAWDNVMARLPIRW